MRGCKEDGDDGEKGSERWPGGARPSRWRRRASAGGERLAKPPADVGQAQAERRAAAAARRGLGADLARTRGHGRRALCLAGPFLAAGEAALKSRPADGRDLEIGRLKAKVGELTMANELLDAKIARLRPRARGQRLRRALHPDAQREPALGPPLRQHRAASAGPARVQGHLQPDLDRAPRLPHAGPDPCRPDRPAPGRVMQARCLTTLDRYTLP